MAQQVERGELLGRDAVGGEPASDESSISQVLSSASTARDVAAAGLLISCARPAASVPSVMSDSRWRAVASIDRAVRYSPWMKWPPKGNQRSIRSRSAPAGTLSTRADVATRPVAR